jgi:glutathione S-transferase
MKFYYSPGACSLGTHISLYDAGLKFSAHKVDLKTHQCEGQDYFKVNPKGYVPALEIKTGLLMTETAAILQWVADQAPEKNLIHPWGTAERYKDIETLNYLATEIHKGFAPLWNRETSIEQKEKTRDRLKLKLAPLAQLLSEAPYLSGEHFQVTDAYLFTLLRWTKSVGPEIEPGSVLEKYFLKINERPMVRAAMKAEGLI